MILIGGTLLFFYVFTWFKALSYAPAHMVTVVLTGSLVVGNLLTGAVAGTKLMPGDIYSNFLIILGVTGALISGLIRNRQNLLKNEIPAEHE
jgi:regulator of RNase E activity RraA